MSKRSKAKSRRHKKPRGGEQGLSAGEVAAIDESMGAVPISDGSAGQRIAAFGLPLRASTADRAFGIPGQPATKLRQGGARPLAETLAEIERADVPPPPGAAYEYLDRKLQDAAQPERGMGGNQSPSEIAQDVMDGKAEARRMAMTAGVTPEEMGVRLERGIEPLTAERIAQRSEFGDNPVAELLRILGEDKDDDERMILEHLGEEKLQRFLVLRQRLLLLAESEVDASLEIAREVSEMWNLIAEKADEKITEGRQRVAQIQQLAAQAVRERNRGRVYDYMRSERLALARLEAL